MASTPSSSVHKTSPAASGPTLCLLDSERCHYTLCLPARMAEADPQLRTVATRLQAILQSATRAPVTVTAERSPRSLFLLIDLDPQRTAGAALAFALQQQGEDILISGKSAAAVALGIGCLLKSSGFEIESNGAVRSPAGRVTWTAQDHIELTPAADSPWLRTLLPADSAD